MFILNNLRLCLCAMFSFYCLRDLFDSFLNQGFSFLCFQVSQIGSWTEGIYIFELEYFLYLEKNLNCFHLFIFF